jgi:hypothetical protein
LKRNMKRTFHVLDSSRRIQASEYISLSVYRISLNRTAFSEKLRNKVNYILINS